MGLALIVDPSEAFGHFVAEMAQATAHEVLLLKTGEEAIQHPQLCHATLIMAEALLPDATGFEVAARVRETCPSIPIVIMSFDPELEALCHAHGLRFVDKSRMSDPVFLSLFPLGSSSLLDSL